MNEPDMRDRFQRLVESLNAHAEGHGEKWDLVYQEAKQRINVRLTTSEGKETATVTANGRVIGSQSWHMDVLRIAAYCVWHDA